MGHQPLGHAGLSFDFRLDRVNLGLQGILFVGGTAIAHADVVVALGHVEIGPLEFHGAIGLGLLIARGRDGASSRSNSVRWFSALGESASCL